MLRLRNPRIHPRRWIGTLWLTTLLAAGYGGLLVLLAPPALVGTDDHGYYLLGRLMASEHQVSFQLESPVQFVGDNWLMGFDERYRSRFPPGFPALIALVQKLTGVEASFELSVVLAALGVAGLMLLVARWCGPAWGATAAGLLMLAPPYTGGALLGMSNLAAATVLLWGILFLLRWSDTGGRGWALAAGFSLGLLPAIRLPEGIVAIPLGLFLLDHLRRHPAAWRSVPWLLAAGGIPLSLVAWYNWEQFGGVTRSAYVLGGEVSAFGLSALPRNLRYYAEVTFRAALGALPVLAVAGWAVARRIRGLGREVLLLAGLVTSVALLYLLYGSRPNPQPALATRFLLPAIPLVIAMAMIAPFHWTRARSPRMKGVLMVGLLGLQGVWSMAPIRDSMSLLIGARRVQHQVAQVVRRHLVSGDVLTVPPQAALNLDSYGRWRIAARHLTLDVPLEPMRAAKARTMEFERRSRFAGLDVAGRDSVFLAEARRWGDGHDHYLLMTGETRWQPSSSWMCASHFVVVDSIRLGEGWKVGSRAPPAELPASHRVPPGTPHSPDSCPLADRIPSPGGMLYLVRWKGFPS